MNDGPGVYIGIGFAIGAAFLGLLLGSSCERKAAEREAVKAGHAEWVDAPATDGGKPVKEFKWREVSP